MVPSQSVISRALRIRSRLNHLSLGVKYQLSKAKMEIAAKITIASITPHQIKMYRRELSLTKLNVCPVTGK